MKKYCLLFAVLAVAAIVSGCHTCPQPEESMECFPMCINDKENIRLLTEKDWNSFKNFRPIPYVPVGIRLIDNAGIIISKLSVQITKEIVIPYVELDKDGMISLYYEFMESVKIVKKTQNCSSQEAVNLVWNAWLAEPNGRETCMKLQKIMPIMEQLRASQQISNAIARISPDVARLLYGLNRDIKQLEREVQTTEGKIKISLAGAQVLLKVGQLSKALAYLGALKADRSAQEKEIEEYFKSFETFKL